jgi:hypothetical protein
LARTLLVKAATGTKFCLVGVGANPLVPDSLRTRAIWPMRPCPGRERCITRAFWRCAIARAVRCAESPFRYPDWNYRNDPVRAVLPPIRRFWFGGTTRPTRTSALVCVLPYKIRFIPEMRNSNSNVFLFPCLAVGSTPVTTVPLPLRHRLGKAVGSLCKARILFTL